MQRKPWFEFHDHRLYPAFLRDLMTDALQSIWNAQKIYSPIAPRLANSISESGARRVIDLCSGAGGPWLRLLAEFDRNGVPHPPILLTDKYPSRESIRNLGSTAGNRLSFHPTPVDAMEIPANLTGFRTMFSTFHHFGPAEARAILKSAFEQHHGIGIFEAAKRDATTLAAVIGVPFIALRLTPRICPFRWSRILWTYCLPVIPITLWLDGMLSCLRSYSQTDLRELISGLTADNYRWEIGEERGGLVAITYLIGCPCSSVRNDDKVGAPTAEIDEVQMQKPARQARGGLCENRQTTEEVVPIRR
jgi:hypothetical protein